MNQLLDELRINRDRPPNRPARRPGTTPGGRAILLAIAAVLVPAAIGSGFYLIRASPRVVDVVTVVGGAAPGSPAPVLTAGGYVKDPTVVYVAPKVSGRIAELAIREGDEVQAGDLIALLDSRDLAQESDEARAGVDLAEANLATLQVGSRVEAIAEGRDKVEASALATARAAREVERTQKLFDAGIVSAQTLDQAQTEARISAKNLDATRQTLAALEAGPRLEEIRGAKAALAAARARWQTASNRLSYARVMAPVAGRVLRKFRNVGDFVSPDVAHIEAYETVAVGSPIVSLAERGRQEASADVNETDIAKITLAQAVEITPNAYPGEVFSGLVTRVSPRADRNKNTVEVKVTIEKAGRVLPYDTSVKLTFLAQPDVRGARDGLWIPAAAVSEQDGARWVFVAVDARASRRSVELGRRDGGMVRVTRGLSDGDRVIVFGLQALADGSAITIK